MEVSPQWAKRAAVSDSQQAVAQRSSRLGWFTIAALGASVLALARWLTPNADGLGTHTQLGLPPCLFHVLTGWPCPACGLTTAFAHMARGEFAAAFHAHALGVPLFAAVCAGVPTAVWAGVRGLPLDETLARLHATRVGVVFACLAFVYGCVRVAWQLFA